MVFPLIPRRLVVLWQKTAFPCTVQTVQGKVFSKEFISTTKEKGQYQIFTFSGAGDCPAFVIASERAASHSRSFRP